MGYRLGGSIAAAIGCWLLAIGVILTERSDEGSRAGFTNLDS